jgi:hypothetical protein
MAEGPATVQPAIARGAAAVPVTPEPGTTEPGPVRSTRTGTGPTKTAARAKAETAARAKAETGPEPTADESGGVDIAPTTPEAAAPPGPPMIPSPDATRMHLKRRRAAVVLFLVLAAVVLGVGQVMRNDDPETLPPAVDRKPTAAATTGPGLNAVPPDAADNAPVVTAAGRFAFVGGYGPALGSTGTLRRFTVAVEKRLDKHGADFADEVDRILGDPRSWIAGRQFRLQRVPSTGRTRSTMRWATSSATGMKPVPARVSPRRS